MSDLPAWGLTRDDVGLLACPSCRGGLAFRGTCRAELLEAGALACAACGRSWPVAAGLPGLVDETQVGGLEAFMRLIYDHLAVLHDPAVQFALPVLQGSSATSLRDGYLARLDLGRLAAARDGSPARVLEVGVGSGANLPLLEAALPPGTDAELWGVDLSSGMLARCRTRLASSGGRRVRLLHADAHALPFPDASFDRVFHVGGIATYRDARRGLAEMARVARPRTPIVVVDEQLDPTREHSWLRRLAFRAITFYDPAPASPRPELPAEAVDVHEEQVSRFYYCLTFRMP